MDKLENNTSPELLVELINEEINRVDSYSTRSGANPWILLAALAGIVWMIFPKIYDYSPSYSELILPFMVLYVAYDLTTNLISTFNQNNTSLTGKIDRFQFTNVNIGGIRNTLLFELAKVLLVITMISYLVSLYNHSGLKLLFIPYAMTALLLPLIFTLSFFKIPLNTGSSSKQRLANILLTLIVLFCFTFGLHYLIEIAKQNPPSMISWQISGSFLVISIIIGLLARSNRDHSPLLNSLIYLRRDLILNNISFESALNQADIIFCGLSISHLLQDEVEKVLEQQRKISKVLHAVASEYEATKNAALKSPDDKCILCSSLTRSVKSYMAEVESLVDEYGKMYKKFTFRSLVLLSMSSSSEASMEFNKLNDKIAHNLARIKESLSLVKEKSNSFETDLNCKQEIKQIAEG